MCCIILRLTIWDETYGILSKHFFSWEKYNPNKYYFYRFCHPELKLNSSQSCSGIINAKMDSSDTRKQRQVNKRTPHMKPHHAPVSFDLPDPVFYFTGSFLGAWSAHTTVLVPAWQSPPKLKRFICAGKPTCGYVKKNCCCITCLYKRILTTLITPSPVLFYNSAVKKRLIFISL